MLKQLKLVVRTCVEEETRAGIAEFVPVSSHWRLESLLGYCKTLGSRYCAIDWLLVLFQP
jgi:hypothetical protein